MENSWATFGRDLHLDLTGHGHGPGAGTGGGSGHGAGTGGGSGRGTGGGLRAALLRALRDAVRSGRLAPGTRLPSSRSLAADLGIARNTVADAYAELVAEGWLSARQGSGTRVAERALPRTTPTTATTPTTPTTPGMSTARRPSALPGHPAQPRFDLTPGTPDVSAFPRTAWLAAARRALTSAPSEAFGYSPPAGRPELRAVLADYLARARGVHADPDRIIICTGFMQGLALLARALGPGRLATESYGLDFHRDVITLAGLHTTPLPIDEHGARTEQLGSLDDVRAALLTPAHQFPTGVPLHPDRRAAAVNWARATGGYILEDDYDGEFRYDRQPVGALQGLDPDHVVYLGTASKSLAPALRLAWMVLPDRLVDPVLAVKRSGEWASGALEQLTLAEFISSGGYDRHLRGMRLRYRRRRDQLVAALAEHAPHVHVSGIAAGLHALLELPPGTEQSIVQAARWQGLALEGLSRFRDPAAPQQPTRDALVVTYGRPPDHAFGSVLNALLRTLPPEPAA
ncbi:putative GntR family transcriptional regulator [Streptomyces sp. NBRC 110611]|uniref:MocR-like pyridoxine biosynthesis transcription factor PdxR n=1 Tax=Streptomyces sp. NBRC 110611 TaxID=1621259 RepID=UPI000855366A|nr:PLP-dependent aminotransferase family protein [Streptomyces sp. NBRC 110611]GAU65007.1 putative GntR family transcriptional regulator [Streptomyces sp. NBRC 110611]